MTKILTICTIGLIALFGGCTALTKLLPSGNTIITGSAPTPTQQLWKAAKNSNWLVTLSILGIAAGGFAFMNGSKMGLPCIGASCISLFMALAVARYSGWMAVFGMIGSLAAIGISVVVKNKAIKEIVMGGQRFKKNDYQPHMSVKAIFNGEQAAVQSKSTCKLVQNIKNKLKLKGKI